MDHKYRKKPIVIEAFQMTERQMPGCYEWPQWLVSATFLKPGERNHMSSILADDDDGEKIAIGWEIFTLEGVHQVTLDDYIIQGINGELYPCKPDIFEKTYEKVE